MESSKFKFRQLRIRDAPTPPNAKRLVLSEQAQLFFEIFGDRGAIELVHQMRDFYWQARQITPAKERKDIKGMVRLAIEESTRMNFKERKDGS